MMEQIEAPVEATLQQVNLPVVNPVCLLYSMRENLLDHCLHGSLIYCLLHHQGLEAITSVGKHLSMLLEGQIFHYTLKFIKNAGKIHQNQLIGIFCICFSCTGTVGIFIWLSWFRHCPLITCQSFWTMLVLFTIYIRNKLNFGKRNSLQLYF